MANAPQNKALTPLNQNLAFIHHSRLGIASAYGGVTGVRPFSPQQEHGSDNKLIKCQRNV
jgi:hypothetical protein